MSKKPIKIVKDNKTSFYPENWTKTFFQWMNEIEPWCISRQIWWGHRIPAWYYGEGNENFVVAKTLEEAIASASEKEGRSIAADELRQDEDVLDTWFSSALWPFSTLDWPNDVNDLDRFYPTSLLITGFDIIFFWVARMIMMTMHLIKDDDGKSQVPFKTVYVTIVFPRPPTVGSKSYVPSPLSVTPSPLYVPPAGVPPDKSVAVCVV